MGYVVPPPPTTRPARASDAPWGGFLNCAALLLLAALPFAILAAVTR